MKNERSQPELAERLNKLMRPLSERGHGPDHDRLRELYLSELEQCVGDPLDHALSKTLQELLPLYLQSSEHPSTDTTAMALQAVCHAIEALAKTSCRLEEHNYKAAADTLQTATSAMHELHAYIDMLHAEEPLVWVQSEAAPQTPIQAAASPSVHPVIRVTTGI